MLPDSHNYQIVSHVPLLHQYLCNTYPQKCADALAHYSREWPPNWKCRNWHFHRYRLKQKKVRLIFSVWVYMCLCILLCTWRTHNYTTMTRNSPDLIRKITKIINLVNFLLLLLEHTSLPCMAFLHLLINQLCCMAVKELSISLLLSLCPFLFSPLWFVIAKINHITC